MLTLMSEQWIEAAACRRSDPELFFPVSEERRGLDDVMAAKSICATCPVVRDCLAFAVRTGEPAGIWGGRTAEERRLLRREPQRAGEQR